MRAKLAVGWALAVIVGSSAATAVNAVAAGSESDDPTRGTVVQESFDVEELDPGDPGYVEPGPWPRCGFKDAQPVVRTTRVLVVDHNNTKWACSALTHTRRVRLGKGRCPQEIDIGCGFASVTAAPDGWIVGYRSYSFQANRYGGPTNYVGTRLRSVDVRTGETIFRIGTLLDYAEATLVGGSVAKHVVGRAGALAWVTYDKPTGYPVPPYQYEVRRYDSTGLTVLATGADIDPESLALDGTQLSWMQGGVRRSATLR
jgi:hypothetical protein